MSNANANVEIDLTFSLLGWMLFFVSPRLSIDGMVEKRHWGENLLTLAPGRHVIEVWFPYLFPGKVCLGSIVLHVVAGQTYKLRYRPTKLFTAGAITVVEKPLMPAAFVLPAL